MSLATMKKKTYALPGPGNLSGKGRTPKKTWMMQGPFGKNLSLIHI